MPKFSHISLFFILIFIWSRFNYQHTRLFPTRTLLKFLYLITDPTYIVFSLSLCLNQAINFRFLLFFKNGSKSN